MINKSNSKVNLSVMDIYTDISEAIAFGNKNGFCNFILDGKRHTFGWQLIKSTVYPSKDFSLTEYDISDWDDLDEEMAGKFWLQSRRFARSCKMMSIAWYGNRFIDRMNLFTAIISLIDTVVWNRHCLQPGYLGYLYTTSISGKFDPSRDLKGLVPKWKKPFTRVDPEIREIVKENISEHIKHCASKSMMGINLKSIIQKGSPADEGDPFMSTVIYTALMYATKIGADVGYIIPVSDVISIYKNVIDAVQVEHEVSHQFDIITRIFEALRAWIEARKAEDETTSDNALKDHDTPDDPKVNDGDQETEAKPQDEDGEKKEDK